MRSARSGPKQLRPYRDERQFLLLRPVGKKPTVVLARPHRQNETRSVQRGPTGSPSGPAEDRCSIDDHDGLVHPEREILKRIIHANDFGSAGSDCTPADEPVRRHSRQCEGRVVRGFVSDIISSVVLGHKLYGSAGRTPATFCQHVRPQSQGSESRDGPDERRGHSGPAGAGPCDTYGRLNCAPTISQRPRFSRRPPVAARSRDIRTRTSVSRSGRADCRDHKSGSFIRERSSGLAGPPARYGQNDRQR